MLALTATAQDRHTVRSPDGKLEFQLFVNQSEDGGLPRIAYRLSFQGKPLLETSYLGFDILDQEPILGEKAGLMSWSETPGAATAHYMQDGSIGRRIDLEIRVWNDGVAFRYVIPRTPPLENIQVASELTEFDLPGKIDGPITVPFTEEIPGAGWISIGEQGAGGNYPVLSLARLEGQTNALVTRFHKLWESKTPVTTPWRVIGVGETRQAALDNGRIKGEY